MPPLVCDATGKMTFPSPRIAERERKRVKKKWGDVMQWYRCEHCRQWHLGHSLERWARRPRRDT